MLDAHQLNVFLVAAETLNFTKTAHKLHMTQPSVSQHIQALEKHFGNDLFLRNGRHIALSPAGENLVPLAREMLFASRNIEDVMASLQGDLSGELRIGCGETVERYILPQLLAQFSINNPKVAFTCSFSDEAQMLEQLCEGALDLALTTHQTGLCNDVENQQVFDDVIDLVVPAEHAWAKKGRISPKELAGTALILRDPESTAFATVYESLLRAGLERNSLNSRMILDSEEAIVLSVLAGLGPGFASRRICEMLGVDSLSQVRIDGITIIRPIYLQRLTRRADHPVISAFWDSIAAGQATIAK